MDERHHLTLVCQDLAQIGRFARMDNWQFRIVRQGTPGSFTFLLPATAKCRAASSIRKRSTIGVRVPDHPVVQALLAELGEPILSSTLILPGDEQAAERCGRHRERASAGVIDAIVDAGPVSRVADDRHRPGRRRRR